MSSLVHLWGIFLGTLVGLLPIINPLAAGPTFLAITEGDSDERRRVQARKGCLYMVGILVCFLVGGTFIMSFFGISIAGLRITGGILLVGIGLDMLRSKTGDTSEKEQREAAKRKNDISFSPLAMPMLSGPGSIAVTLGFTSLASRWIEYAAIIAGIVAVALITYFVLRVAGRLVKFVGPVGVNALTRIMGFLLMSIGVQFIVNGMIDPELLRALRTAWDSR